MRNLLSVTVKKRCKQIDKNTFASLLQIYLFCSQCVPRTNIQSIHSNLERDRIVSVANSIPYTQRIEKYFRITAQRDYDRDCDRNNRYPILPIDFCY